MQKIAKKAVILASGWVFVLLGVLGLFLPVLQGILFLLIGLFILSTEYVWAHHLLHKLKSWFPGISSKLEEAKMRAEHWISKVFSRGANFHSKQP